MVRSTYILTFFAALLLRAARALRVDFAPWWDGVGWSYADIWTSQAAELAFNASTVGLEFRLEGLLYVPLMGLFLKVFGFTLGIEIWAWALVLISAAIPVMAAGTVHTLTGRLGGGVVVAILVTLDPVLEAFGLNGWSDSITFFAVSLSFFMFARAVASPTHGGVVGLGLALAITALSHATWTWPALAWAVMAWPLLALRRHWSMAEDTERPVGSTVRFATPLLTFIFAVLAVNFLMAAIGPSSRENLFPVLSSDPDNQRALVSTINPDVDWYTWEPADSARTLLFVVPGLFPSLVADLIGQQITGVMYLSAWLLSGVGAALLYLAATGERKRVSRWSLLTLPAFAWLAWSSQATLDATVPALILILALAWIYVPPTRGLLTAILPITVILAVFLPHNTHFRHSNAVLYAVLLIFGVVMDAASVRWQARHPAFAPLGWHRARSALRFVPVALIAALVICGTIQSAAAYDFRRTEEAYLRWLGGTMEPGDVLLTSGNVNPWGVQGLVGAPVVYDVEHGSRLFVTGDSPTWGPRLSAVVGTFQTHEEFLSTLGANGRIWFYRPGNPPPEPLVTFSQLGVDAPSTFYTLDAVDYFADTPGRPGFIVGRPVEDDRTPPDLPSQTGRG